MRGSRCSLFAATWVLSLVTSLPAQAGDVVFRNGFDPGFQVQTPDITIAPGETATYCYFFRTPNTGSAGIRRWSSLMQAGMHHLILYAAYDSSWQPLERQPPGTLTQDTCGLSAGDNPAWIYAAHEPSEALVFPGDDGSGAPLAVELLPNQPVFLQMYVFNAGSDAITTSALLEAESLGVAYTKTATYLTVNTNLSIPPNVTGYAATETCAVPPDVRFWWLSTRTHHFAVLSEIEDATSNLVVNNDWEHPAAALFTAPAFYTFSPSGLTYQCTYDNPTPSIITSGDDEVNDETCMGIGYFFPATRPSICINDIGPL